VGEKETSVAKPQSPDHPTALIEHVFGSLHEDVSPRFRELFGDDLDLARLALPQRAVLGGMLETCFFASITKEEGRFYPLHLICSSGGIGRLAQDGWLTTDFTPIPLTAASLAKCGPLSGPIGPFLVVCFTPDSAQIDGLAFPPERYWTSPTDHLLRISVPVPGELELSARMIGRISLRAGRIARVNPSPLDGAQEVVALFTPIFGPQAPEVFHRFLRRIHTKLVNCGHGGILAILGDGATAVDVGAKPHNLLAQPFDLGALYTGQRENEAHGVAFQRLLQEVADPSVSFDDPESGKHVSAGNVLSFAKHNYYVRALGKSLDLLSRLLSIDGAVILSRDLKVLAYGVKLLPAADLPDAAKPWRSGDEPFDLTGKGTRHTAAASFAMAPKRVTMVVSQDRHATVFFQNDDELAYVALA
jgi:hypothetical protein